MTNLRTSIPETRIRNLTASAQPEILQGRSSGQRLSGCAIPQGLDKKALTTSHEIALGNPQGLPDLVFKHRRLVDPGAKSPLLGVSAARLAQITKGAQFQALLTELLKQNQDFLSPDQDTFLAQFPPSERTNFAYNSIRGRRVDQFIQEVTHLLDRVSLSPAEATQARQALNIAGRELLRSPQEVQFDNFDTGTYWSYSHDAVFVHVFEKLLASLQQDDPKRQPLQKQIDFILTHKYTPQGQVQESHIEQSLQLVAIDANSRHVASMTKASEDASEVQYETLQIPVISAGVNAGKYAYRDGKDYYLEGTITKLTLAEIAQLSRKPISELAFRRPGDVYLRSNFRFDWDGDGFIGADAIDTHWYGHCDIKALIESTLAAMPNSGGVVEYNADSGVTTGFSRADQLEALAALLNMGGDYVSDDSLKHTAYFGERRYAGIRFNDKPTNMDLKLDSGEPINLKIRISDLSERGNSGTSVDLTKEFSMKIPDSQCQSFQVNPDMLGVISGDFVEINASGRKVTGTSDGQSFNADGLETALTNNFVIDPNNRSGSPVLIGTQINDAETREVVRYYYDPKTQNVSRALANFAKDTVSGKYVAREQPPKILGKVTGMNLSREVNVGDSATDKQAMLTDAVRTGVKIATDSNLSAEVWNGQVSGIQLNTEYRSPDQRFERVGVLVDATFSAGNPGTFINRLDPSGNIVDTCEVEAAADFYWQETPRVAPVLRDSGINYLNQAMVDRGIIPVNDPRGQAASIAAIRDLGDLIFLGLQSKNQMPVYTVVEQGERKVYDLPTWTAKTRSMS